MNRIIVTGSILLISLNPAWAFDHDHSSFDALLRQHVTTGGRVNYQAFKSSAAFQGYLSSLSAVSPAQYAGFSRNQKMVFLINAYNAFTIKLITDHMPVSSIRKIGGLLGSPWKVKFFKLLGQKRHLDYIEHSVLRPVFKDARIHFAVVCASKGCPPLLNRAYAASHLNAQLNERTKSFLKNTYYNECRAGKAKLSSIFKWYQGDFGGEAGLKKFIGKYNPACNAVEDIDYKSYDWSLNKK